MTKAPTRKLPLRGQRIKNVAAIVLGRDPTDPSEPTPGWMAKLSRLMGLSHSVVSSTLYRPRDDAFDNRFQLFIWKHRIQMLEDIKVIEAIEAEFDAEHFDPNFQPEEGDAE
jgi:hypothetical protein